jgi:signal transduction histidine kinase
MIDKGKSLKELSVKKIEELEQLVAEKTEMLDQSLKDLKLLKNKLIQHEKMATLGMLSAGIAHEIKNPLNFVNNFSELSIEYIEEIQENLEKLEKNEITKDINNSLQDIKSNLHKIQQHGLRVNRIVKSMLLHARGSNGKSEPTDINDLVREYINLSFHGMRAGKNPINVSIEIDLDDRIGMVQLIPEDFSRVILNLCNNAFDAMREKNQMAEGQKTDSKEKYSPKLKITSKILGKEFLISVEDNGLGIPDNIKDKLMQPFFTTKKGNAGTGLGLSISNEIIKAHQGRLEVETKIGEFTRFDIFIPQKN